MGSYVKEPSQNVKQEFWALPQMLTPTLLSADLTESRLFSPLVPIFCGFWEVGWKFECFSPPFYSLRKAVMQLMEWLLVENKLRAEELLLLNSGGQGRQQKPKPAECLGD